MSIFDLLFLAAVLGSLCAILSATVFAVRGRGARAIRVLRIWVLCVGVYLSAGVAVSFFRAQSVKYVGEPWCFDDWCLTVQKVTVAPTIEAKTYRVDLLLHSRARRVGQRAKGAWIYLIDGRGRRYSPDPDSSAIPLDTLLQPQESKQTTRTFRLPANAPAVGLITGHGGAYCGVMSFLVIGESGCLFRKPAMVRVDR